jgi:transposase
LGILKALVVKRVRGIPSDRELYRRLWSDPELRELCDIEEHEKPYHPSQLTRFRQRIGPERLERIMETIVGRLRDAGAVKGEIVACDATFIKAYSKRDQRMTLKAIAIQKLGLEGLGRVIGSATSST